MFFNLVRIELIRLFNNKTLKYTSALGLFIIIFWVAVVDYLMSVSDISYIRDVPASSVELVGFVMSFAFAVFIVSVVAVIFTTSDYRRHRLAVNIEGAVRNRLRLYLSEIVGVVFFVAVLNLLVIPGSLIIIASDPAELGGLIDDGINDLLVIYLTLTLGSVYSSVVVYLISRLSSTRIFAIVFSLLYQVVGYLVFAVAVGLFQGYNSTAVQQIPDSFINVTIGIILGVPVLLLILASILKNRKADRI
ncbi:MAG: hypothetical protein J6127_01195 [Clostridiales bacterium]|nr:hypothetical protein [Clostridiales bacterium]